MVNGVDQQKHGRVAFITTPDYRERKQSREIAARFIFGHMHSMCYHFNVLTTGNTRRFVEEVLDGKHGAVDVDAVAKDMRMNPSSIDLDSWKRGIRAGLEPPTPPGFPGMIHATFELVESRLDAVIHFTTWQDKSAKPDSAVLSREANVHVVPIATDPDTAAAFVQGWRSEVELGNDLFKPRKEPDPLPLYGIKDSESVIALVAHDKKKLEMCEFAVANARQLFARFDWILATGTTGRWLRGFMQAAGHGERDIDRIRRCNSGPLGGDIQIAYAVVERLCQKIIFFQDPSVSHPHDSDIRLFEQAVAADDVHVELATNVESAKLLLGISGHR